MLSPEELKESPLFQNISYESYLAMYDCFQAVNRSFRPYEVMYDYTSGSVSADSDSVGVIERGTASLIRIDENGVATVLEELGPGGVFGKALAFAGSSQDVLEVVCRTACEVVYIRYSQILKRCENACLHHSLLVQNMLRLISEKAQALSQREHPGKAPVLFPAALGQGGEPPLHPALHPGDPGGLHRHGPQRHDAGAPQDEGGGAGEHPGPPGNAFGQFVLKRGKG